MRSERYKLINFYSNDGFNLHDLEKDPHEMRDVSKKPEYQAVMTEMKAQLERLREQYQMPDYAESATH